MDSAKAPYNKVIAGTVGGAVGLIVVSILEAILSTDFNQALENAIVIVCVFLLGYFVPERTSVGGQLLNRARRK